MQTDLITNVYFNEHLTHSCVGMPQGLQALSSSLVCSLTISVYFYVAEVTLKFFQKNGLKTPILVKDKTGLNMRYMIWGI